MLYLCKSRVSDIISDNLGCCFEMMRWLQNGYKDKVNERYLTSCDAILSKDGRVVESWREFTY